MQAVDHTRSGIGRSAFAPKLYEHQIFLCSWKKMYIIDRLVARSWFSLSLAGVEKTVGQGGGGDVYVFKISFSFSSCFTVGYTSVSPTERGHWSRLIELDCLYPYDRHAMVYCQRQ